ncbi:MAG TPA: AzlC family ABC transporter permease [Hyphomicrobiaceae bacterium]|jgi:predicted branched-subunit amino acid permease|nr:AzlC family ABC transporter permease [Hyphomicrobiaceae bacterium]
MSPADRSQLAAFGRGLLLVWSVPAFVLFGTALGFGALARDGGFSVGHATFVAATMFALPNQVVLIDQLARNEAVAGVALAVALTAMRLMPMTVTLAPLFRGDKRRPVLELLASHFVAVSTWIEGNRRLPLTPAGLRLSQHFGQGVAISMMMVLGTLSGYALAGRVPDVVSAALLFMTPLYFVLSLVATSRSPMDLAAILIGCALSPLMFRLVPGFDLLATGLVGGTAAFLAGRRF